MAVSPSNKKTGKSYLNNFTKDELVQRGIKQAEEIMSLEQEVQDLRVEKAKLEKEKDSLERKFNRITTDDFIIKKILDLRAKNFSPVVIQEKLSLEGIDKPLKMIKDVLSEELSPSLELYFNERKKEYADSISINTTFYHQSSVYEIQRLIDSASEDLERTEEDDIVTRSKLRDSISNYIAKRDNLMKNINEVGLDKDEEDKQAEESLEKWAQESENAVVNLFSLLEDKQNVQ